MVGKITLAFIVGFCLVAFGFWCLAGFVTLEFNMFEWSKAGRAGFAIFTMLFGVLAGISLSCLIYEMLTEEQKRLNKESK